MTRPRACAYRVINCARDQRRHYSLHTHAGSPTTAWQPPRNAACLLPFSDQCSIHHGSYSGHFREQAAYKGALYASDATFLLRPGGRGAATLSG